MDHATVRASENLEGLKPVTMNLQFFGGEDTPPQGDAGDAGEPEVAKTYTEEEFQKKLQSETDKRVTEALETSRAKWEKEYQEKLQEEKDEAAKMAKMTSEQKAAAELAKERHKFEEEKQTFERERLELQTRKTLQEQGLSESFAPFLLGADADETLIKHHPLVTDAKEEMKTRNEERRKTLAEFDDYQNLGGDFGELLGQKDPEAR